VIHQEFTASFVVAVSVQCKALDFDIPVGFDPDDEFAPCVDSELQRGVSRAFVQQRPMQSILICMGSLLFNLLPAVKNNPHHGLSVTNHHTSNRSS